MRTAPSDAERRTFSPWDYVVEAAWWVFGMGGWAVVAAIAWVLLHQISPPVIEACRAGPSARVVAPPFDRSPKP